MKRLTLILFIVALCIVPLSGLSAQDLSDTVILAEDAPVNFNPLLVTDGGSNRNLQLIWPYLFHNDPMTGLPVPSIATWTIAEDGLTYTFTIRDDAVWSDGVPISSNDVKFTIEASQSDLVESPLKGRTGQIQAVNIIDDKNFELVLGNVNCALFSDLIDFRLLPAHRFAADFSDIADNSINTAPDISGGPYLFVEWRPDEFVRYQANPTYWAGKPKIENLIIRPIADNAVEVQALQTGEVDFVGLFAEQYEQLTQTDDLNIYMFPGNLIQVLAMNWADPANPMPSRDADGNPTNQPPHPIFGDVRVRQAVAMGYDKSEVTQIMGGERAVSFVSPTVEWAFNSDLEPWSYDPERAAELLDEAGWLMNEATGIREKDGQPLQFEIILRQGSASFEAVGLIAQDYLSRLGMDVTAVTYDPGVWLEKLLGQEYDIALFSWGSSTSPEPSVWNINLMGSQDRPAGASGISSYDNPEVEQLLADAMVVPGCDAEARAAIYREAQVLVHDDVAYDFLAAPSSIVAMNKRIINTHFGPWYRWAYDVHLWEIQE